MPLKIVGACLPRTGTLSLKTALERLGFAPCHHMVEMFDHPEIWPEWEKIYTGRPHDWEKAMPGYQACADAPSCFFYKELAERYPDAKVIMSTRSAESWLKSVRATVGSQEHHEQLQNSTIAPLMEKMFAYMAQAHPGITGAFRGDDDAAACAAFEAWQDEVRRTIAPERLLVFEAKQGWAPLCEFLGVPVPDEPYPRINSTDDFVNTASKVPTNA